jgi:putative endonuclease
VADHQTSAAQGDLPGAAKLRRETRHAMWYVYFLQLSNGDVYVGSTNDLKRRFFSHQSGKVTSTKAYTPVVLKSYVAVATEDHARELEIYFKSGSGKAVAFKRLIRRTKPA